MVQDQLAAFQPWAQFYRKQAETHIQNLATKIGNLQREIEDRAGGLLDQRDELIAQRLWLQNEWTTLAPGDD